jgi:hypothetical protein
LLKNTHSDRALEQEADTQQFVFETLKEQPHLANRVRVPEVYYFVAGHPQDSRVLFAVIVMEYVLGPTIAEALKDAKNDRDLRLRLWEKKAIDALKIFAKFEPELDQPLGPVGGGRIEHLVFGRFMEPDTAPQDFDTIDELQDCINEGIVSTARFISLFNLV